MTVLVALLASSAFATAPATFGASTRGPDVDTGDVSASTWRRDLLVPAPDLIGPARRILPVVNGSETSDFPNVFALIGRSSTYGDQEFCSGELIDSKHIATAAHCIVGWEDGYKPLGFTMYAVEVGGSGGSIYNDALKVIKVSDYTYNSAYDDVNLHDDIGMVTLSTAVKDVDVFVVNTKSIDGWGAKVLTYVGYGITGDGQTDSGVKRTTDLDYTGTDGWFVTGFRKGTNICEGDSGGAVLETATKGLLLVGINSYVSSSTDNNHPCNTGGTGGTRVDLYTSWLTSKGATLTTSFGDTDTDTDTDSDTDADTDADTDTDTDTDSDNAWPSDPSRPPAGAYDRTGCASAPSGDGSLPWTLGVLGLIIRYRRRSS